MAQNSFPKTDERYWRERLLWRRYPFGGSGQSNHNLAARIDHAQTEYYFPLGTTVPEAAARKARDIYRMAVRGGWETVCRRFSRELMVGFEWNANPILWTYTTIHTLVKPTPEARSNPGARAVLVVESDVGLRRALVWCVNQQPGVVAAACEGGEAFESAWSAHRPQLVLLNRNLAGRVGCDAPGQLAPLRGNVMALTYSSAVDGDRLFVSTPGGAGGYVLKRVPAEKCLEPICNAAGQPEFSADDMPARVRAYFKEIFQSGSVRTAAGLGRLTPRELEVLALLSKGCVDKEIAQALGISAWTVHGHVKKIFERLHVRTRTEAVVRYLEK